MKESRLGVSRVGRRGKDSASKSGSKFSQLDLSIRCQASSRPVVLMGAKGVSFAKACILDNESLGVKGLTSTAGSDVKILRESVVSVSDKRGGRGRWLDFG